MQLYVPQHIHRVISRHAYIVAISMLVVHAFLFVLQTVFKYCFYEIYTFSAQRKTF